jgi:glucosamine--fructose-6-phosphate aminotransferase (isomerizing)
VPASEILLFPKLVLAAEHAAIFPVLISRSGHTSEVLRVAGVFKSRGIEFMGVTCDGNELAQLTALSTLRPGGTESFRNPGLVRDFLAQAD